MGSEKEQRHEGPFLQESAPNNWTAEQWRAITYRGENILVAAGAGTGKTRVLVERILQQVKRGPEAPDIDKFLIVTFTNAAAAEMKQRIGKELERALQKDPTSHHLRRQLLLLNRASISTVHSFCLEVIKGYYYLRDLDPSFRILNPTEAELLRQEVLEELLEEYYAQELPGSPFYQLVDIFSSDRGDQALQSLVLRLYDFSRSHLWPADWLQKMASRFAVGGAAELEGSAWVKLLLQHCRLELESILLRMRKAAGIAQKPGGPTPYLHNLQKEISVLQAACYAAEDSQARLFKALQSVAFKRLKRCSGNNYNEILKEKALRLRNSCKDDFAKLHQKLGQNSLEEQARELNLLAPLLSALVDLILAFAECYQKTKKEKGLADFSDLEHNALQILSSAASSPACLLPSEAALEYRQYFDEVLIDEYQDINQVQEAILQLVSTPGPGGNLFMVGDVKQSIYRFRLAEPELFQKKQHLFSSSAASGKCIGLTHNFRSREEILRGVNFLFGQLMDENVGELPYDQRAWLRSGAAFPETREKGKYAVEVLLLDRFAGTGEADTGVEEEEEESSEKELDRAGLEGRLIAGKIRALMGKEQENPFYLYDRNRKEKRPLAFRDIVILLRSARNRAPALLEELRSAGIPAYVELDTGYFAAVEVEVMLSLLKIIDNPFQDIPLAAVLRSPVVGLDAEAMARLRLAAPGKSYYEALRAYCRLPGPETAEQGKALAAGLQQFLEKLYRWQELSREGSLSELIWQLYRDTGYYDFVGGMPGGNQRQANLRALYERARQYEATSFRGLFQFLRFVEKLKERGGDLGEARALGEQEDVVRIMTIHKSKGLEFPVVFVAGLASKFNLQDLRGNFLVHKELGFGPKYIDTEARIAYPTLPYFAVQERLKLEQLAEEMRILYVALTRAEEKLFLVATIKNLTREVEKWEEVAGAEELLLPAYYRAGAGSILDWIGPTLLRHPQGGLLRERAAEPEKICCWAEKEPSSWKIRIIGPGDLWKGEGARGEQEDAEEKKELYRHMALLEPIPTSDLWQKEVDRRLSWRYSHLPAGQLFAKISVSELQKIQASGLKGEDSGHTPWLRRPFSMLFRYPRFLQRGRMSAGERGTAYHTVMQHLSLFPALDKEAVEAQMKKMVQQELLNAEEFEAVDPGVIMQFFQTLLGQRVLKGLEIIREVPFSMSIPAAEIYSDRGENLGCVGREPILVQGVIDCLLREKKGLVLIDYKTGRSLPSKGGALEKQYRLQMEYYTRAVERIWQERVIEKYLYFFDSQQVVAIDRSDGG